jgi:hypothetical protein
VVPFSLCSKPLTPLGVLCGSIYLNKRFRQLLESKIDSTHYSPTEIRDILDFAEDKFDRVTKLGFAAVGNDQETIRMNIPGLIEGKVFFLRCASYYDYTFSPC